MRAIDQLHAKAKRAISSGEEYFREAADYLGEARKLGATQRQSAKAVGKSPPWVLCHEYRRSKRRCATVREIKEGPSRPAVRGRPQTTASCCRQKRWWCCVKKMRERHAV